MLSAGIGLVAVVDGGDWIDAKVLFRVWYSANLDEFFEEGGWRVEWGLPIDVMDELGGGDGEELANM